MATTMIALGAIGVVAACEESSNVDKVNVEFLATSATVDPTTEGLVRVDAAIDLFVPEGVELTLEGASVTFSFGDELSSYDAEVVSHDFPVEGRFEDEAFPVSLEIVAELPDGTFAERCQSDDAVTVKLAVRAEGGGWSEVIRSQSRTVPLIGREVALPTAFSTDAVVEHPEASFGSPPPEVLPTSDGELILNWRGGRPVLQRLTSEGVSAIATDAVSKPYRASGEYSPISPVAVIDGTRVVTGSATGPFEITIHELGDDGPIATETITTNEWWAVDGVLRLQYIGRASTGAYAVVQSAAPLVIGGVEYPADAGKYFSSFVVTLDDALTPVDVQRFDRAIIRYDVLADGTILSLSSPLGPTDEEAGLSIERRAADGSVIWSTPIGNPLEGRLQVEQTPGGDFYVAVARTPHAKQLGNTELLRISGEDGTLLWTYAPDGMQLSVAPLPGEGALVSLQGSEPASGDAFSSLLLVELTADGGVARAAPVACGGSAVVATTSAGETVLLGSFRGPLTLGGELLEVGSSLVVASIE